MHKITARCPAKLNLTFDIVGLLPNGYHEVATLYQTVSLEDKLTFELDHRPDSQFEIVCDGAQPGGEIPCDSSNLIWKAAGLFIDAMPDRPGLSMKVNVEKNIPVAAGMAGGSTNAAATLVALNNFFGHPFGVEELLVLAGKLGADVPFCLEGGTCVGRGCGDDLTVLKEMPKLHFLLVKPENFGISTAWAYQAFDELTGDEIHPDMDSAVEALKAGDTLKAASFFGNAFEPLIFEHYPQLAYMRDLLLDAGCWCCHLTGKGPTMYAVVPDYETAGSAKTRLLEKLGSSRNTAYQLKCFTSESVTWGARLLSEK
jgi:4-diphosphocytidyl-2-C-methyl-D-erythritol kinase